MNKEESPLACLLPTGSADEEIKGISHLFEHMLISELDRYGNGLKIRGHTTEDYVILFCMGLNPEGVMDVLQRMRFAAERIAYHKKILIDEIEQESANDEEAFFYFVWQGTEYEKSPLGTVEATAGITPDKMEELRQGVLKKPIYFYRSSAGLEIINGNGQMVPASPAPNITWRRNISFRERGYDICYFNQHIETFYLLTRVLKNLNPDKHIQLSEKKRMSALVLESGTTFPTARSIGPLRREALKDIDAHLLGIRANERERALNELESVYFYGRSWPERIKDLMATADRHLLELSRHLNV